MRNTRLLSALSLGTMLAMGPAGAFAQPDAGQTVQQLQQPPQLPSKTSTLSLDIPGSGTTLPGGPTVRLQSVAIQGNSVFSDAQLFKIIGDVKGKTFDLAGLKALADGITAYYHANGYPFARALIPAQKMSGGHLQIQVVEGRYGDVKVLGKDERTAQAQSFLGGLRQGDLIASDDLERANLLLSDQPGYRMTPFIRPGQQVGTGDLMVQMERDQRFGGQVGLDSFGNRYTGRGRGTLDLYANSPFSFGDQLMLSTIYTEENMWYGALGYNRPLGHSGLRGSVSYSHTYYELGKEFANLDAQGTAKIASAGLSYPFIRSQNANLSLAVSYQHKWLNDEQKVTGLDDSKSSDVVPLALSFDRRDGFAGGGITYGVLSWTYGVLDLDQGLLSVDATTAQTDGSFSKVNLDVARLQNVAGNTSLFGRFAGQMALDNLDSSESFGLGGPNGVRAYPTGESFGDQGMVTQIELRQAIGMVAPYAFYDFGHIRNDRFQWAAGDNDRSLSGTGVGVRFNKESWTADASLAWRLQGGSPQSDSKDRVPMLWVSAGYKF